MSNSEEAKVDEEKEILNYKYIIIGDAGVGKTSILHNFIFGKFQKNPKQTVNVEYSSKTIQLGNKEVRLQLWDTAGQERFKSVTKSYYKNAIGVIIVYDITKSDSFQHINNWLKDAKDCAKKNCCICVIGNKSDLSDQREVPFNDAVKYCQDNQLIFFECSAVTGDNIEEVFNKSAGIIYRRISDGEIEMEEKTISTIAIEEKDTDTNNGGCGC